MKQTRTKIALFHHTGCGNLGDDAIIDAVIGNIRQRWESVEIAAFSMNPHDTEKRHAIPSYPIRRYTWDSGRTSAASRLVKPGHSSLIKWIRKTKNPAIRLPRAALGEVGFLIESYRTIRCFDLLIVSGGGQLTERGGPWSFPYALFIWSFMAKRVGVKSIFLNVGAGPLNHRLSRFFVTRSLAAADYVSFRDKQSQELACAVGFTGRSHVFPDNVYSFKNVPPQPHAQPAVPPVVGFAPMPYPFGDLLKCPSNTHAIQGDLIGKLATFASLLAAHTYSVKLFGSDTKADPPTIEALRIVLQSRYHICTPEYNPIQSVDELLSRISAMDYVVTCRFHGVVLAHLLNKPVLAIAHHPKVTHLMSALGLSKYCVDMRTFDPARLMDTFSSLVSDAEAVKSSMAASLARYRAELAVQLDGLFPADKPNWIVPLINE
jgi:polysaccharide pyruvyl transferase WcaK-like protein